MDLALYKINILLLKYIIIFIPGGKPPPDTDIVITKNLKLNNVLFWIATGIAAAGIAWSIACVVFNVYYRDRK